MTFDGVRFREMKESERRKRTNPKINIRSAMKPSVLRTILATLVLSAATSALAQKPDSVSPNEPKVTICHNGRSLTVAQSAVPAHLAHGDSVGPCASEPNVLICHRGRTLNVAQSAVSSHLAHGDSLGECSSLSRSEVSAPAALTTPVALSAPAANGLGTPTVPQPALAKTVAAVAPVAPNQTPQTPAIADEVALCYKGQNVTVTRASVQTYLSIGATLGACNQKAEKAAKD
jgi:hypothetical protein